MSHDHSLSHEWISTSTSTSINTTDEYVPHCHVIGAALVLVRILVPDDIRYMTMGLGFRPHLRHDPPHAPSHWPNRRVWYVYSMYSSRDPHSLSLSRLTHSLTPSSAHYCFRSSALPCPAIHRTGPGGGGWTTTGHVPCILYDVTSINSLSFPYRSRVDAIYAFLFVPIQYPLLDLLLDPLVEHGGGVVLLWHNIP